MAGDFQKQFNEALKEAELDDVKKSVDQLRSLNPASEIRKQLNPFEKAAADVRSGLDSLNRRLTPQRPQPRQALPIRPNRPRRSPTRPSRLKNGAAAMSALPDRRPCRQRRFPRQTRRQPIRRSSAAPPSAAPAATQSGTPVKSSKPAARARQSRRKRRKSRRAKAAAAKSAAQGQRAATGRRASGECRSGQDGCSQTGGKG